MNWAFSVKNKTKASITLLLLCGIVFFSNYRLKSLSAEVAQSVKSIYEDRLMVQDLIFSYSNILARLEMLNEGQFNQNVKNNISVELLDLGEKYERTVLTEEEDQVFHSFAGSLSELIQLPETTLDDAKLIHLKQKLKRLEEIQMEEAQKQMVIIEQAKGSQELSFYLETAVLVILLIIVQVLVVSNTTVQKTARREEFHLN